MKLESQVCSLELAQKLKSLGVKQDSVYYWRSVSNNTAPEPENWYYSHRVVPSDEPVPEHFNNARLRFCSAFTVAELYSLLYSNGICDILITVKPEELADYLAEMLCKKLSK